MRERLTTFYLNALENHRYEETVNKCGRENVDVLFRATKAGICVYLIIGEEETDITDYNSW